MAKVIEKALPFTEDTNDRKDYYSAWSNLSSKIRYPMRSTEARENGSRRAMQESTQNHHDSVKTVKFSQWFTLIIIVVLSFGLLIQQGSLCFSK